MKTLAEEQKSMDDLYSLAKGYQLSFLENVNDKSIITLKSVDASLKEIEWLLTRINKDSDEQNQIKGFREELSKGRSEGSNLRYLISEKSPDTDLGQTGWVYKQKFDKGDLGEYLDKTLDDTLGSHVQRFNIASGDLQLDVNDLNERILKQAEQLQHRNEVLSKFASALAFFLFVSGSAIGIVAKVYGIDTEAAGEDD